MKHDTLDILDPSVILENLTRTVLYEGYALYPYHRSAIKNQKPIPIGVVYPQQYNNYNEFAASTIQTDCIATGSEDAQLNFTIRFLHLKKIQITERISGKVNDENEFVPAHDLRINGISYQSGWQTIERTINTGKIPLNELLQKRKVISFDFEPMEEHEEIYDEFGELAGIRISKVSGIKGSINIDGVSLNEIQNSYRFIVQVINTTPIEHAENITRDDVFLQSFLSTHTVLIISNGEFISNQNPDAQWENIIHSCNNINSWPILIDKSNTTVLSSPIILYDYPQINPQSPADLFDSTEIEEALLLHITVLSDEEKQRIGQNDEKLKAMLNKVNQITPEEMINFHTGLKLNESMENNKTSRQ